MYVGAGRVKATAERLARAVEDAAVLEELAVLDAVDPDIGRVADLVIGAQGLRVVGSAIARHEVELLATEFALHLREYA